MSKPLLEEVFKRSGLPTYTFVEPAEFGHLKVALRTPGRGLVVEGPSGIGKTTAVRKAAEEVGIGTEALLLSGRSIEDKELIAALPSMKDLGLVIIDDFHRLDDPTKHSIADYLKQLADNEDSKTKLILIGINKAGDSLVSFAPDLNNRIDTIHFEVNDDSLVSELIGKGEKALNIKLEGSSEIVKDAGGSFHIAQLLCHETCLFGRVTERLDSEISIPPSLDDVKSRVLDEFSRLFLAYAIEFARGRRFRREGRAPYLHLLYALRTSDEWTVSIDQLLRQRPEISGSLGQVITKGHLTDFLKEHTDLQDYFHYDAYTRVLAVEDPKMMYFLGNLLWTKFVKMAGFISTDFVANYDFALSFAGEIRKIAEYLASLLKDYELEVFYDRDEQHSMLAQDVEQYLAPIYASEARFVSVLLSKEYPKKIWTKFESEQFKARFGSNSVIPIWFADAPVGMFDESARVGGLTLDPSGDVEGQLEPIAQILVRKVEEERLAEQEAVQPVNDAGNGAD